MKPAANKNNESSVPFDASHNHHVCIRQAVTAAENLCAENSLRFTGIRRRVLELIWSNHQPTTAYNLLKKLRQEKENAEPPTVYRALDFLVENNLVHRIESLNAFIGCDRPDCDHIGQFMICSCCNKVAEIKDTTSINKAIDRHAARIGFRVERQTLEIVGICPRCQ